MPRQAKKVDLPQDRAERLTKWYNISRQLKQLQDEEHQLRQSLVTELFSTEKLEGTETKDIGYGWKLRATKENNITATNKSGQMNALLDEIYKIDQAAALNLVTQWEPKISKPAFREALEIAKGNATLSSLLAAAITVKPGLPQLEMLPPKEPEASPVVEDKPLPTENDANTFTDGSNVTF